MRLLYFCQNEGPFHMRWLDEMAKEIEIYIYHIGEYEPSVNPRYIDYHTKNAKTTNIRKRIFGLNLYNLRQIQIKPDDVILFAGYGIIAQQLFMLLLQIQGRRYIISVDGGFVPDNEMGIKRILKRKLISGASLLFSTCRECDDYLIYYGGKKDRIFRHYLSNITKKDVAKNPAGIEEKKLLREKLGLRNIYTFISVGKFIHRKGFDILSDALDIMEEDCQALIIGADDNSIDLGNISHKMKLVSFKEKEELREYYRAADVFVLSTRLDVWGLVVSEAMSSGLPVITTDKCLAGVSMVKNGENGYIVPVGEAKILADRMSHIMKEDTYRMGSISIDIADEYCIENSAKRDVDVLLMNANQITNRKK